MALLGGEEVIGRMLGTVQSKSRRALKYVLYVAAKSGQKCRISRANLEFTVQWDITKIIKTLHSFCSMSWVVKGDGIDDRVDETVPSYLRNWFEVRSSDRP